MNDQFSSGTLTRQVTDLADNERLVPILPMIYVAWADGDLSDDEIRNIRATAADQEWLDADAKNRLGRWLDPADPPTAQTLNLLLRSLQDTASELDPDEKLTLVDLGVEMARLQRESDRVDTDEWLDPSIREALEDVEHALGMASRDACRDLLRTGHTRPKAPVDEPPPAFDHDRMVALLDGDHRATRNRVRALLDSPQFDYPGELTTEAYREQVLDWLEILADEGLGSLAFPESAGGEDDMGRFITAFETLAMFDQSLVVKYGVQFGLFGGSILFLGSDKHHQAYLPEVGDLSLPGGFAMTELGHGSNVRELETTATYEPDTEEFVLETPSESARKEWIGNAADHGQMVTVFAQLEVGEDNYGVHAFLVPIRDDDGEPLEGVRIEDCGHKMGLNGVDNGRLWFDEVRIPRENLLDKYGEVDADGEYSSPIPSAGKRFFTMIGTLVGGRVSVAAAGLQAMKSALTIAVRFGARRRQFGPAGEPESQVLDYRTHQRRLMPRVAEAYALTFGLQHLKRRYAESDADNRREVEALAAGMKAYTTWSAIDAIQTSRECCGGMGYLTENRIAQLRKDIDIYATFEGDNTVLMLLVARGLLGEFQAQFADDRFFSIVRYVADQAATTVQNLNPVVSRNTDSDHLRSADFQLDALEYRAKDLLRSAATRMQTRLDSDMPAFEAVNEVQDHLISLANAHIEKVVLEKFQAGIEACDDEDISEQLELLRSVWAMDRLHEDIGWFLENSVVEPSKSRAIRTELNELCREARQQAVHLVDAFGIPKSCLAAPIAFDDPQI
jgi:acyl-CoA oxidase